ncbi:MAG: 50S ribosomal protein L4 [Thermodesulfovibrionales bacterium]
MAEVGVKDINNNVTGTMSLPDELFAIRGKEPLMHDAVVNYLANQRQGTHATKTRGLVSGGGKKPWRQKHTGRARAGSNRSPIWRGGGTVFGPQPRDYSYRMPRQARKLALYAALSAKLADGEVVVVEGLRMEKPRTRRMVEILGNLGVAGESALIVTPARDEAVLLSARNVPGVTVMAAADLHAYDVLAHARVLVAKEAMEALAEA